MEKTIFLKDVLRQIELKDQDGFAVPFDIEVREFSAQNKTGGKYKTYNSARLLISKPKSKTVQKNLLAKLLSPLHAQKNPNHHENQTRNIELANGEIKTVNIRFIIKFNGKYVVY